MQMKARPTRKPGEEGKSGEKITTVIEAVSETTTKTVSAKTTTVNSNKKGGFLI